MKRHRIVFLGLLFTFAAATAGADTAAPLFASELYTSLWLVLIPIVIAEMVLARRIIGVSVGRAFAISLIANAVSTIIGVPFTWLFFVPAGAFSVAALFSIILLVPAFFLTVFVERRIAYLFVAPEKRGAARQWSWRANLYTYEGMLAVLLVVAVYDEFFRR